MCAQHQLDFICAAHSSIILLWVSRVTRDTCSESAAAAWFSCCMICDAQAKNVLSCRRASGAAAACLWNQKLQWDLFYFCKEIVLIFSICFWICHKSLIVSCRFIILLKCSLSDFLTRVANKRTQLRGSQKPSDRKLGECCTTTETNQRICEFIIK